MTPTYKEALEWFTSLRKLRFDRKFRRQADDCLVWTGVRTESGHGIYWMGNRKVRTHRLMFLLAHGQDLPDDLAVRHFFCQNKACGNPEHLVPGTWEDNNSDRVFHDSLNREKEANAKAEYMKNPYKGYFNYWNLTKPKPKQKPEAKIYPPRVRSLKSPWGGIALP
jgi:HNH endonuclease